MFGITWVIRVIYTLRVLCMSTQWHLSLKHTFCFADYFGIFYSKAHIHHFVHFLWPIQGQALKVLGPEEKPRHFSLQKIFTSQGIFRPSSCKVPLSSGSGPGTSTSGTRNSRCPGSISVRWLKHIYKMEKYNLLCVPCGNSNPTEGCSIPALTSADLK